MTKKVVHLVYSFGFGGLEQVIVNLINNSTQFDVQHVIITLVDKSDLHSRIIPDVKLYTIKKSSGNDIGSHIRIFKLLKKINPDVVHTYNFGVMEYQITAFLAGVKTQLHSEHGYGGDDSRGKNRLRNLVRKVVSLFLDRYIVVSPDLYQWCRDILCIDKNKLIIIYNGVDTVIFSPTPNKYKKYTLCTIGRTDPVKNQSLLIDAYVLALRNDSSLKETQLLIVGSGPLDEHLTEKINELGMEANIKLLGFRSDIGEILKKCHLFVLSSVYEAMPMTILEAMACSIPVISTNVGGVHHLLSESEGWLVESGKTECLADQILYAFNNQDKAKVKGNNGREIVETKYGIDIMVENYMNIYLHPLD